MANNVRIGFVGAGSMGQCAHLRNYLITPGCEVVALAELRAGLAATVAQRYGIPRVYPDHRAMLEAETLDAIVSIQPYQVYGRLLPELLAARVPVLIEKPLARSVEAGQAILRKLNEIGGRLFVGYHKRSDPATAWALRQIAAWKSTGAVGALRYVRVTMPPGDWIAGGFSHCLSSDEAYPALAFDPPPGGMDEPTAKRYDAFVNYYIHQVNLIRLLLGERYRVTYADPCGVLLAGASDGGAVAVALEMAPYRTTVDWQETALVAFEKGWIKLELPAPLAIDRPGRVTAFEGPGDGAEPRTISPTLPLVHAMRRQAEHFVAEVRGDGPTVLCRADEALEDLELARRYIELAAS
jgi:predicted dehydrogenase